MKVLVIILWITNVFVNSYSGNLNQNSLKYSVTGSNMNTDRKFSHKGGSVNYGGSTAIHGSVNIENKGSMNYHGSTAIGESSHKGSMKHHGSTAIRGSMKHHGSTAIRGSTKHYGSTPIGGSTKHHGSTAIHRSSNKGSMNYHGSTAIHGSTSNQGSFHSNQKGSTNYHGSTAIRGSIQTNNKGSANYRGSGKGSGTKLNYFAFSPTREPTEALPPVIRAPPPTFYPTVNFVPELPNLSYMITPTILKQHDITVPEIPLTFQIQQGTNGWASYPDSPPSYQIMRNVISRISGVKESAVTNVFIKRSNKLHRRLSTSVTLNYSITVSSNDVGLTNPDLTYTMITSKLFNATRDGSFSNKINAEFNKLNISERITVDYIRFSEYTLVFNSNSPTVYPTEKVALTSNGGAIMSNASTYIVVSTMSLVGAVILVVIYFVRRNIISKKLNNEISVQTLTKSPMIEVVNNPRDSIPRRL
jgi:hypothetical protein